MAVSAAYGLYIHWGGGASANGRMVERYKIKSLRKLSWKYLKGFPTLDFNDWMVFPM